MPDISGVTEVTCPVEFVVKGDRLHFTLISGARKQTFAISFHKARGGCHIALRLLDDLQRAQSDGMRNLKRV